MTASVLFLVQSLLAESVLKKLDNMGITLLLLFLLLPSFSFLTVWRWHCCSMPSCCVCLIFEDLSSFKEINLYELVLSLGILPSNLLAINLQPVSLILTAIFSIVFDSFLLPVLDTFFTFSTVLFKSTHFLNGWSPFDLDTILIGQP